MKKLIVTSVFVVVLAALFYATPYLVLWRMKAAADAGDYDALSSYVDYSSLRESAKRAAAESGFAGLMSAPNSGGKTINRIAGLLGAPVMEAAIDAAISPQGLALLMQGKSWSAMRARDPAQAPGSTDEPRKTSALFSARYDSFNEFSVAIKKTGSDEASARVGLTRDWLIFWKLTSIRFSGLNVPPIK